MATATQTATSTTATSSEEDEPKYRIEHSVSAMAVCQQAACKRAGTKIAKGELRLGTRAWFEQDQKFIRQWRHWGCATKKQIKTIKELAEDEPAKVPGYDSVSAESQEQVRLAFEQGMIVDTDFKDIRPDLSLGFLSEIRDAIAYRVEVTTRAAGSCRKATCPTKPAKIAKGELRLGVATLFQGEHETWAYKHWRCATKYELQRIREFHRQEELHGLESLPDEYRTAVLESLERSEVVNPPLLELPAKKPKKSRKKKVDIDTDADTEDDEPKPPKKTKQSRKRKADTHTEDDEPDPPKKAKKSRKNADTSGKENLPRTSSGKKLIAVETASGGDVRETPDAPQPTRKLRSHGSN